MKKVSVKVTAKGEKSPNKWKKDQVVKVHPNTAKQLIERELVEEYDGPETKTEPKKK